MKKRNVIFVLLAVALAFGLLGCGDKGTPKDIEGLFNKIKGISVGNLWAFKGTGSDEVANIYCYEHKRWEGSERATRGGFTRTSHDAAPSFAIGEATSMHGWVYYTDQSGYTSLAARVITKLDAFYEEKYKTEASFNPSSLADGTTVYAWYDYWLFSDGRGNYGRSPTQVTTPLRADRYQF